MKLIATNFEDLILIKQNIFIDNRGYFKENFKVEYLEKFLNKKIEFCQQNSVKSKKYVLRVLHFQKKPSAQSKLISISHGKILDIAVDIRKGYSTYGKYFSYVLDAEKNESLFIPKGFAHGYLTLSDYALVNYSVDNYYNPNLESGILYNDGFINIDWGIHESKLIISKKDKNQKTFNW